MFRFHSNSPVTFQDSVPDAVDVAIIGGGVIGISTAWYLLKRGLSVFVADKGRVAGEQSSRNWGWVRVTWRDEAEVPIAIDSLNCWQQLSEELDEDLGFTRGGIAGLAFSMDTDQWYGGVITPSDARAEPFKAVPAMARAVQAKGGLIRENCAVRTLDFEAGKVAGVHTEDGLVRANAVLCAAGAWSNMFLSNLGIRFPQLAVKSTVARTAAAPGLFSGATALHDVFVRRRQDGGYTVASGMTEHMIGVNSFRYFMDFRAASKSGSDIRLNIGHDASQRGWAPRPWGAEDMTPFERTRVFDENPSKRGLKLIRSNLDRRLPELANIEFAESWAGMIDATPDVVPVMDQIESHPGLYLASGFSGHGFGIGPGAGKVMAEMICGGAPRFDLTRFRFARFFDGSKLVPGPAI
jgi:glycine/D-amino acid oxidase-like deaminating enzyme